MGGNEAKAVLADLDGIFFDLVDHFGEFGVSARSADEVTVVPGLRDALERVVASQFLVLGITNQPDIARGKISREFLAQKHNLLLRTYPQIRKVFCCEHTDTDVCECRKPKPGLLFQAAKEFDLDLTKCWVVGDSRSDIEAGTLVHARTVFVLTKYNVADPAIMKATVVAKNPKKAFTLIADIGEKEGLTR